MTDSEITKAFEDLDKLMKKAKPMVRVDHVKGATYYIYIYIGT
jgi:hypothetical protein